MKQKLLGISVLIATLCLMTACSTGGGAGSAAGSQPDQTAPQTSAGAPANQENEPASSADVSAPADGSAPAASTGKPEEPDSSAPSQASENSQGKPLFTGSFAEGANPTSLGDPSEDSYIQSMEVDGATVALGRFSTNHGTEAFMDEYNPSEFDVTEKTTVSGHKGTHYRWKTDGDEGSTVVDAVVAEADGYSLLFLSCVPQDVYEGLSSSQAGPTQATVESWMDSLTVTGVQ